jgi:hypothetical protein
VVFENLELTPVISAVGNDIIIYGCSLLEYWKDEFRFHQNFDYDPMISACSIHTKSLSSLYGTWSSMIGETFRLGDRGFKKEVRNHAREMMKFVRRDIDIIVTILSQKGYQFAFPEKVRVSPDPAVWEWIEEYENKGIYLPLSLQAWLSEVGCVNLMGSHPEWDKTAYIFKEGPQTNGVWYTDPLVVELTHDDVNYCYEEWKDMVEEGGIHKNRSFFVSIAPDHIHKANISGGPPFQLLANQPAIDAFLINERHCTSFVGYVMVAIAWAGFPGFYYIDDAPKNIVLDMLAQLDFKLSQLELF